MGLIHKQHGCSDPDCGCAPSPCEDCMGDQSDATVVLSGSCNVTCQLAAGVYTFESFTDSPTLCRWVWTNAEGEFDLLYCKSTGTWCSHIQQGNALFGSNPRDCLCGSIIATTNLPDGAVSCSGGLLTAGFVLSGLQFAGSCQDCIATITI